MDGLPHRNPHRRCGPLESLILCRIRVPQMEFTTVPRTVYDDLLELCHLSGLGRELSRDVENSPTRTIEVIYKWPIGSTAQSEVLDNSATWWA
jgi:hypothetical protein